MIGNARFWFMTAVFCLAVLCSSCEKKTAPAAMPSTEVEPTIVKQIREVLPEGWLLKEGEGLIRIEREALVDGLILTPGFFERDTEDIEFWFELRPVDTVSPEEYSAIKSQRIKLERKAFDVYEAANMREYSANLKSLFEEMPFNPRTADEEEAVRRLDEIRDQIKPLPQLYSNGKSYRMEYPAHKWGNAGYLLVNDDEHRDCLEVVQAVRRLFHLYEGDFTAGGPENPISQDIPPTPFCSFHEWKDR